MCCMQKVKHYTEKTKKTEYIPVAVFEGDQHGHTGPVAGCLLCGARSGAPEVRSGAAGWVLNGDHSNLVNFIGMGRRS